MNDRRDEGNQAVGFREEAPEHPSIARLLELPPEDRSALLRVGVDPEERERSGTFLQRDHSVVHCRSLLEGVEVLDVEEALGRYDLEQYWWRALAADADAFTRRAREHQEHGYFIRSLPGARVTYPLQACLYISEDRLAQDVHNLIIAEEGSELHVITGCAVAPGVRSGLHVGVSEFYVKRGARLTFTMVHNWAEEMTVRPRTAVVVEEGGTFVSHYICLLPARDLQTFPTVWLRGRGAVATFQSVLLARAGSRMDVGSRVILQERGCRAEVISRAVSTGGLIVARGHLVGASPGVKAHLECRGLLLDAGGVIHAIPELEGRSPEVEMSHEAAVGRIAREEIEYLMARGLTEQQATSLIVKGFLSLEIEGLPPALREELDRLIARTDRESL